MEGGWGGRYTQLNNEIELTTALLVEISARGYETCLSYPGYSAKMQA